ncbi:MAG: hypothetical protein OXG39_15915 [Chloroflexi bacterium]|nr:hypothetical protein [Chloroflexota bacterium]
MLAAQVLVILWSMEWEPSSNFERWLQVLTGEYNIPATLASIQLALVGCAALLTARIVKARHIYQRLYNIGVGLAFLFLALDEYHKIHERMPNWGAYYFPLGAVVVLATTVLAIYSPRRARKWQVCLLAGLAISGAGGIGFELMPTVCDSIGPFRLNKCLLFSTIEEALEFVGVWLALVAVLGQFSVSAPGSSPLVQRTLYAAPILWVFLLLLISFVPVLEIRLLARQASVRFQSGVNLHGYTIETSREVSRVRLYASSKQGNGIRLGYSIHLVDQVSGISVARSDEWEDRRNGIWLFGPEYAPIYGQMIEVEIPPQTPVNRAYWVILSLWRKNGGDYARRMVLDSDLELLSETQVLLDELVIPTEADNLPTVPLAEFENGFILEAADLPVRAQSGETLSISFAWRSNAEGREDHAQFLHLGLEEAGPWFVHDQQPLGPRLPARLWYSGLADSETWRVPLPADLAPGQYSVFTGIYRARDQERVPASNAEGARFVDGRVPLGRLTVE